MSLDGRTLISTDYFYAKTSRSIPIKSERIWDTESGRLLAFKSAGKFRSKIAVCVNNIEKELVVAAEYGITLTSFQSGKYRSIKGGTYENEDNDLSRRDRFPRYVIYSSDNLYVAVACDRGFYFVFDLRYESRLQALELKGNPRVASDFEEIAFTLDNQYLHSLIKEEVQKWEIPSGKKLDSFKHSLADCLSLTMSRDGKWIAGISQQGIIKIENIYTMSTQLTFETNGLYDSIKFSTDSRYILTINRKNTLAKIWISGLAKNETPKCVHTLKFQKTPTKYDFHHNGKFLVSFDDGSLACWHIKIIEHQTICHFIWSSDITSPDLCVEGLQLHGASNLDQNRILLEQGGAIMSIDANLITKVAKRSGSPLHSPRHSQNDIQEHVEHNNL